MADIRGRARRDLQGSPGRGGGRVLSARSVSSGSILVVGLVLGGLALSTLQSIQLAQRMVETDAAESAAHYAEALRDFRNVYAEQVVGRALASDLHVTHDYRLRRRALPTPTTLVREFARRLSPSEDLELRIYSSHPFPWRAGEARDAFERDALDAIRRDPDRPFWRRELVDGREKVRYAIADRMQESCIDCHNGHRQTPRTGWKVGDVAGVIEVARPLADPLAHAWDQFGIAMGLPFAVSLIAMSSLVLMTVRFRDRTRHAVETSSELGRVNATLVEQRSELMSKQRELMELTEVAESRAEALEKMRADTERANRSLRERAEELEKARRQADAANRSKSEFLANMSHEIRTPMTAILGFAETLQDADLHAGERLQAVDTIKRNGDYLLAIINDILDLSKIEAGKMTVEMIPCSPFEVLDEVVTLMRVRADAKGLPLEVALMTPIPETIRTDSTRLRQILVNLIGNAIKFTERGRVRVEVSLIEEWGEEPRLEFDIVDTGIGMDERQSSMLFRPFTQADSSMTRRFGGTGLGLAISHRMANMLGGTIVVADTEPGRGTRFRATIATGPIDGVLRTNVPQRAKSAAEPTRAEPVLEGHVLVAEDGPDNRRLLDRMLRKSGLETTFVENGALAVEAGLGQLAAGRPYDVILMDMQMPVLDGFDATRQLREGGYRLPIVALTANAMEGERQRCREAGCDAFATKPIARKDLLALIAAMMEKSARVPSGSVG